MNTILGIVSLFTLFFAVNFVGIIVAGLLSRKVENWITNIFEKIDQYNLRLRDYLLALPWMYVTPTYWRSILRRPEHPYGYYPSAYLRCIECRLTGHPYNLDLEDMSHDAIECANCGDNVG